MHASSHCTISDHAYTRYKTCADTSAHVLWHARVLHSVLDFSMMANHHQNEANNVLSATCIVIIIIIIFHKDMLLFVYKYKLDAESKESTRFRDPKSRGCSVPSAVRALLRA